MLIPRRDSPETNAVANVVASPEHAEITDRRLRLCQEKESRRESTTYLTETT